jgi:hypothetical protein
MLNLELPGVSLFKFGCFPDRSFFFLRRLSLRGMFRLFYAASKGVVRSKSKFFRKPERPEYYPKVEIFYERQSELEPATSTFTFAAQKSETAW